MTKYLKMLMAGFVGLALITPALAGCPTHIPVEDAVNMVQEKQGSFVKADDAAAAKLDALLPRPFPNTEMFLVKAQGFVMIALVADNVIVCTSPAIPEEKFSELLGGSGA